MAITLANFADHYQGVSTDAKPVAASEGATLHFIDTGEQYVYHNGMWEEDLRMVYAMQRASV